MKTTAHPDSDTAAAFLTQLFAGHVPSNVAIRLWDDTRWPDDKPRSATLVLHHPGALRAMFSAGTEKALAEAYLYDDFDVEGDIESACELADALAGGFGWKRSLSLAYQLRKLPTSSHGGGADRSFGPVGGTRHSLARDRQAIAFHYDVSDEFYRLWLDREMVYSCAYFESATDDLDTAQRAKLDYLCRKLRLKPGQRLLDIGCGWGGLARHAARNYGVDVVGVTLSKNQASFAHARTAQAGLASRVTIRRCDYRDVRDRDGFDAIVSVGMAEHVGVENLPAYFKTAYALLKPGGVFLNHAIGEGSRYRPSHGPSFIDEYVFPDSDIPPLRAVVQAAETAGFEVRDAENLREHYALTLRHWVRRLEARHDEALGFVNEPTYRVWRLYMGASAHGFAQARLAIYQVLLAKPDATGAAHLPLRRADWYGWDGESRA